MNYKRTIIKLFVLTIISFIAINVSNILVESFGLEAGNVGVQAVNGGNDEAVAVYTVHRVPTMITLGTWLALAITWLVTLTKEIKYIMNKNAKTVAMFVLVAGLMSTMTGCIKPYDKPSYAQFGPDETAFVIQAEGNTENQDVFKSVELLSKSMIAAKRYQIPHKWVQTGRMSWDGQWVDSVLIYRVNRAPVTRVWTDDADRGTTKNKEALEAESRDSLAVASGFTITAYITPEDAPKYLFRYKGVPLAKVIDTQIRNSIQAVYTEECAKYDLLELPKHKQEITEAIRAQVIPFYKEWGITIAKDMGLVGGLSYDASIQSEIDNVFKAQKAKERAEADKIAQAQVNEKDLSIAQTQAEMQKVKADGEAYAISKKAEAIKQAGNAYIQAQFIEKWDGIMPKVGSANVLQMIPSNIIE